MLLFGKITYILYNKQTFQYIILMEMPEINSRILQIIDYKSNGNRRKFAEVIGIAQQSVNRLFNTDTRTKKYPVATTEILVAITEMFVDINTRWLLTGEGEMLKAASSQTDQSIGMLIKEVKDLSAENAILKKENLELQKEIKRK